jgi:hypothetical protein
VPPDRRRIAPEAGGQGKPDRVAPPDLLSNHNGRPDFFIIKSFFIIYFPETKRRTLIIYNNYRIEQKNEMKGT